MLVVLIGGPVVLVIGLIILSFWYSTNPNTSSPDTSHVEHETKCEYCGGARGWTVQGGYGNSPKEEWQECPVCSKTE